MDYKIADLNQKQYNAVKRAEELIKKETGKEFVMIAWEKEK